MPFHLCIMLIGVACLAAPLAAGEAEADGSWFAITPDHTHAEIFDVYAAHRQANRPLFISTDLVLHAGHLLFDNSLRAIELDRLYAKAVALTEAMLPYTEAYRHPDPLAEERRQLRIYFHVAACCLDPEREPPAEVAGAVRRELDLIARHEGVDMSACPKNAEDFSQYVPRGHYTRNETFQRYFKAMLWYGRRMFRIQEARPDGLPKPDQDAWSDGDLLRETRQLLMITAWLHRARIDEAPAIETWRALYEPTALFAGRTEDLTPLEVADIARGIWPGETAHLDGALDDEAALRAFIVAARKVTNPKIDTSGTGRKGFCFLPQRFTPDGYITQCLVTDESNTTGVRFGEGVPSHDLPYTGQRAARPFTWGHNPDTGEKRFMPRGLDVMAVFGSAEALAILEADGDTAYTGYDDMLAFLRGDVGRMLTRHLEDNLYYGWLHALQPLLAPPPGEPGGDTGMIPDGLRLGTPSRRIACFRSRAWQRKRLATALASWAELRHDTILYAKQSYTPEPDGVGDLVDITVQPAYVEPEPRVFERIGFMIQKMHRDLEALGVLPEPLAERYAVYETICWRLAAIAEAEVSGILPRDGRHWANGYTLADDDRAFLHNVAAELQSVTRLPGDLAQRLSSGTDTRMALVADIHTDNCSEAVLEQGVGPPFLLQVHLPAFADHPATTYHGAVFSYYEFKQPMADRLTDEAWQEQLADPARRPELPGWYPASAGDPADPQPAEERP